MATSMHIKLEYPEAVALKRDSLLCEASLLKIIGHIKVYDLLRKKEFAIKSQIKKDVTDLKNLAASVESFLPREEMAAIIEKNRPKIIRPHAPKEVHVMRPQVSMEEKKMTDIEREIDSIREKLARLG